MSNNVSIFERPYKYCPTCKTELIRKPIDRRSLLSCPNCNFIFWNNPKPVVSIILHQDNHILMLQRATEPLKDYWVLPGGFIDYGETAVDAVIREAHEETGIKVTNPTILDAYLIDNDPSGMNIDIIYTSPLSGNISLSSEHSNYQLISADKLPDRIAYKHRQAITDWTALSSQT